MRAPRLVPPTPAALAALRSALMRAEYTDRRVRAALGPRPPQPRTRREIYLRRLAEAGSLGTLVGLFRLGAPVPRADAERALDPADVDALVDAGLLGAQHGQVTASVQLTAYDDLVVAHDRADPALPPEPWHVMLGAASRTLASLTVRRPVRRALDLGTGCGIQALLAGRHADHVVATDVSDRALAFTQINASLNDVRNVECRRGDLFEPVAGERFGLVVSNPPFVISPDSEIVFRDSGRPGDEISRLVVGEAQEHLEDRGHATVLCSWVAPPDAHWSTPIRAWVGKSCEAVLLQFTSVRPLQYAAMWTDDVERWLAHYRGAGIEWISTGAVILRRVPGGAGAVAFQASGAPREDATEQLLRVFDAHADLRARGTDNNRLLDERFRLGDHRLTQEASYRDGTYTVEPTVVSIAGSPLSARVEPDAIHALARLDGSVPLRDVISRTARETGLERDRIERAVVQTARRLYERGFLVLVD